MSIKSKLVAATGAAAASMIASPAAAEGMYFGGFVGAASVEDVDLGFGDLEVDTAFIFGAVVGNNLSDNVRIEGELSYLTGDADCDGKCAGINFDVSTLSVLGNVWVDLADSSSSLRPYIGGGIGAAQINVDSSLGDDDAWGFAYQVGGGVRVGNGFDIGYRYRGVEAELDSLVGDDVEAQGHILQVGWSGQF